MSYKPRRRPIYVPLTRFTRPNYFFGISKTVKIPVAKVDALITDDSLEAFKQNVATRGTPKEVEQIWLHDISEAVIVKWPDGWRTVYGVKKIKSVYYCPKCVDEQKGCPYYFSPGYCPKHPDTELIRDEELTERLRKEGLL
ncbi:MAG: hypothetical protein QXL06_06490 [Nitrososphaerota archaeon]